MKRTGLRVPTRLCVLLSLGHVRHHPWSLSLGNNPVRVFTRVDGHEMNSARSLGKHGEVWLGYSHLPHMPCVAQGARSVPAMERPPSLAQVFSPSADRSIKTHIVFRHIHLERQMTHVNEDIKEAMVYPRLEYGREMYDLRI